MPRLGLDSVSCQDVKDNVQHSVCFVLSTDHGIANAAGSIDMPYSPAVCWSEPGAAVAKG